MKKKNKTIEENITNEEGRLEVEISKVEFQTAKKNHKKEKKKRKKFSLLEKAVLILFSVVFCVSSGIIIWKYVTDLSQEHNFQEIAEEKVSVKELQEQNPDVIGWLKISNTNIDYPVMWTPDSPEYYLYKNFEKEYSKSGSLFLSEKSNVHQPTANWLLHGHNMQSGVMLNNLEKYLNREFLEENPTFEFETAEGKKNYKVIAVLQTQVKTREDFLYYEYDDIETESAYREYIDGLWENSVYIIGEKPEYPQQLISLSTCAYHEDEGRLVVVGVEI